MQFFEELKRRNVFKVGIAYLVSGWLLLQFTEVLSELLKLPDEVGPVVVAVVAIGFPIAVFFAWAFEMTPEGVKRESEVDRSRSITPQTGKKLNNAIVVLLVLAVAYLLFDKFYPGPETEAPSGVAVQQPPPTVAEARVAEPEVFRRSIAVLPFANRSRNVDDEFFVEGVHDDLLTNLARIGSLKVISRTSVLRFKDTQKPIPEIARELGVATVMEGAVQRSGSQIRINVQLIDAETDEHLWAEIFDREMTAENLFAIQSEISEKIAAALKATLSPAEQQRVSDRPTDSLAAYNAYLRGRQLMGRRNSADLEQAMVEFRRAVEFDPEFALAWAGIAELTRWLANFSTMALPESMKIREEAGNRALALNPQLGEAYVALAGLDSFHERWEEAEEKYLKAIELSPGYAQAYDWYSDFLARFPARRKEALAMTRKAEELDPLSSPIQEEIAEQLLLLGQYEAAERQLVNLIQLDAEYAPAYGTMAYLMEVTGRFDEQVIWLRKSIERDPGNIHLHVAVAFALLDLGDPAGLAEVKQQIAEIDPQHWSNGWVETLENLAEKNYAGALESGKWVQKELGDFPDFQNFFGWVHVLNGDYVKARQSFEIAFPEFFERASWRQGLEQNPSTGCFMALILTRTGDEALARDLLETSIGYLENEVPNFVEHADRYFSEGCYLLTGEYEKALDALETSIAHGHYNQWWIWSRLPVFDPVRGTPRFESAMQKIRETSAAQRANLARLETRGT